MASLTFEILRAAEPQLQEQLKEFATKNHYDAQTYTFKEASFRAAKTANKKWVAIVVIKLHSVYDFDDDPFEDEYVFKYAIGSDGSLGRYDPDAPLSQEQVFKAYDTWGSALMAWTKSLAAPPA